MKIAITGASSLTASSLIPMLLEETDAELLLLSSKDVQTHDERISGTRIDYRHKAEVKSAILGFMPQVIINTAAMTNVDACEMDRGTAWQINVALVEHLARLARVTDAHLIHFSTDYVFDGSRGPYIETDIPSPINYYGKTKLAGENTCLSLNPDATVVRTNVLYGPSPAHTDFVRWVLTSMESGTDVQVVSDQFSNPTYIDDLAEAVVRIVLRKRTGVYHVGGADYLSRYDFAIKIANFFKIDSSALKPVTTTELAQPARRPLKGGLIMLKAESDLRMKFRGIESGLTSLRQTLFARALESNTKRPTQLF